MFYARRYPEELRGIILIGTSARLKAHPEYVKRCEEPGEGNRLWINGQKENFKVVEPDIRQVLLH